MKQVFRSIFCAVLILAVIFLGAPPVSAQAGKPMVLKFSHQNPPASPIHKEPYETFLANLEKRSNGRIKTEYYPAEMLVKSRGDLTGVRSGVADIQVTVTSYNPEATPMANLYMLPFAHKSAVESYRSFMNLRDQYIKTEIDKLGLKLLAPYLGSNYVMFSADKPIRNVADLKGLRVRSPGSVMSRVLNKIGAHPVTMASADQYEALQKRTVDVVAHTCGFLAETNKIYETTKTGYLVESGGLGTFVCLILMNGNSWKRLSPDLQKIVAEEGENMGLKISRNYDQADERGLKIMLDHGVTHIVWKDEEKEKVKKIIMAVWAEEAAKLDGKGFPASKLTNEFKAGR
jgi:TRAP-type C4-dicarboxylate transport system substrate-binding protein